MTLVRASQSDRAPQYLFAFESPFAALRFVEKLVLNMQDVAILRDGEHVHVIDGGDRDQRERIWQLAKSSSATRAAVTG